MYAALVALKSTYLLVPLFHFPLSVLAVAVGDVPGSVEKLK